MLLNKGLPTAIEDEPVIENTKKITANCQGFSIFQRVINFFMCLCIHVLLTAKLSSDLKFCFDLNQKSI